MNTSHLHLILLITLVTLLGAGCKKAVPYSDTPAEPERQIVVPEAGTTITLRDCKGEPSFLEAKDGQQITFVNKDSKEHVIRYGTDTTITVPANGAAAITYKVPANVPANYSYSDNYSCDEGGAAGAIFVPPSQ